ncbi:MAG: DUF2779 domain-containing protein [bacterium]
MKLTKTSFIQYIQCSKALWLAHHKALPKGEFDIAAKYRKEEGYTIEKLAYQLFSDGVISAQPENGDNEVVKNLPTSAASTIFQAVIRNEYTECRCDIIQYNSSTQKWDIYEVKSGTNAKEEHLFDLAFQVYCFQQANIPVGGVYVVHVNKEYIFDGVHIEPEKLQTVTDVSERVQVIMPDMPALVEDALSTLKKNEEPNVLILKQCNSPYPCIFKEYCWGNIPNESIYELAGKLNDDYLLELVEKNQLLIKDIPESYLTRKDSKRHWESITKKAVSFDSRKIKDELQQLIFPLYFLDYETFSSAIPRYKGYHAYQQVVFQYSLHILEESGNLDHKEFLATTNEDPSTALVNTLQSHIGATGTIIAWNMSFEKRCNDELARLCPDRTAFLEDVNSRMYDLRRIFQDGLYVDRRFKGSSSIKNVLPVLVPDVSYKSLVVQNGNAASFSWWEMIDRKLTATEQKKRCEDLLKYCGLDSLAMVKIYQYLIGL